MCHRLIELAKHQWLSQMYVAGMPSVVVISDMYRGGVVQPLRIFPPSSHSVSTLHPLVSELSSFPLSDRHAEA